LNRNNELAAQMIENLNEVQRTAVLHDRGPLLILAGAGSGKTRVLTHRLAYLVAARGADPERILAVTFTNKAAGEMRERVGGLLGEVARMIWIGTFHAICLRILKRHQHLLGFQGNLTVFDAEDQIQLIRRVLKDANLGEGNGVKPRDAHSAISFAKNSMLDPDTFEDMSPSPARQRIARIWRMYDRRLREQDGADFDDLLLLTLRLLDDHRPVAEMYARRFEHVLVDEYQDTNRVQFEIVRRLAAVHGNIAVVGDDDQSIYGWRGADISNILEFERRFPGATVLRLEQNYRSTAAILDVANAIIRKNTGRKSKTLWTANGRGEPVRLVIADDEEQEGRTVARRIREGITRGVPFSSFLILYRTHAQSRPFEDAFIRAEIPYRVIGGVSFYQRREVKDVLAYLRLLVNPVDEVSFRRAALSPRRGAGETTIDRLIADARARGSDYLTAAAAAEEGGFGGRGLPALAKMARWLKEMSGRSGERPHVLIEEIVHEIDYPGWLRSQGESDWEDRYAHVLELIEGARSYEGSEDGTTLAGFLDQVALYANVDEVASGGERVTLMSVHNAKGLEYDRVFVTGLEEGLFPHVSAWTDPKEMEEERRLFYVATTRARSVLSLSASRVRRRINYGGGMDLSRFLADIPRELLEIEGGEISPFLTAPRLGKSRSQSVVTEDEASDGPEIRREPASITPRGWIARHVKYGVGRVLSIEGTGESARVEVEFPMWGTKKIVRTYLTIEKRERA
jgi:DNA helicase II / ATP-dependent DNA helicase PcrA